MKCAGHPESDAIGICLACARGVCDQCAVDLGRALACKDRCEPEVRRLLDLRDFSFSQPSTQSAILGRTKRAYTRSGVFFVFLGGVFALWGYFYAQAQFLAILGIVFACYGLWQIVAARRSVPVS